MTTEELQQLESYQTFVALLRDMFQIDNADLDFGLYRVMRTRQGTVKRYFEQELPVRLSEDLERLGESSRVDLESGLADAKRELKRLGLDAMVLNEDGTLKPEADAFGGANGEAIKAYKEARKELQDYSLAAEQVTEVLVFLVDFFGRYYNAGDFIPAPDFGRQEPYSLPYAGEDPYFHWATRGMHYIKTDNLFKNYSFDVPVEGTDPTPYSVRFQLVQLDDVADNNKAKRVLYAQTDDITVDADEHEVVIPFAYRKPVRGEDRTTQKSAYDEAEPIVLEAIGVPPLRDALAEGRNGKSLIRRRLDHLAALGSTDFFVHGDLQEFLERELDFFLKSEAINWEDIQTDGQGRLNVLRAFKGTAERIVGFLCQLENLHKRLFEKKRLVLQADYIVPIRHVHEDLWADVLANDGQWDEWHQLLGLEVDATEEALRIRPTLPVYTKHFDASFKRRLLQKLSERFGDLNDVTDGLLVKSENYGALRTLQASFAGQVKAIYIDPPYNTGGDGFLYKDHYLHGTWLTMMEERLRLGRELLSDEGALFSSIDDDEHANLKTLMDRVYGQENFVSSIIWQKKYSPQNDATWFSDDHDYIVVHAKNKHVWRPTKLARTEGQNSLYSNPDNDERGEWMSGDYTSNKSASERPNLYYPITNPHTGEAVLPPKSRVWAYSQEEHKRHVEDNRLWWGINGTNSMPRYKRFLTEVSGVVPRTLWKHEEVGHNQDAVRELAALFGSSPFTSPKPTTLMERILQIAGDGLVVDFFAGSGTLGHAVVNWNRAGNTARKFVLADMGEYFETVTVSRFLKVLYADEWSGGKPKEEPVFEGAFAYPEWVERSPRLLKVLRLEGHDDTLHNLTETPSARETAHASATEDYLLRYFGDVVADGSPALLRPVKDGELQSDWDDPDAYVLELPEVGGTRRAHVDWMETGLLWLGLDATKYEEHEAHDRTYRVMKAMQGERDVALVIRNRTGLDPHCDREFLEEHLDGFDVYINGGAPLERAFRLEGALLEAMEAGVV